MNTQTNRIKILERQKDLIAGYKRQLTQIVAALDRAQNKLTYVQTQYDKEETRLKRQYAIQVEVANLMAKQYPLEIGQLYSIGTDVAEVVLLPRDIIAVKSTVDGHSYLAGKSLETMSEVFYLEHPTARRTI